MNFIQNIKKNFFLKKLLPLINSTLISYFIYAISLPILSRLYSPSDFGIYGSLISISSLLVLVSSLRYETAIPMCNKIIDAHKLVLISFIILFNFLLLLIIIFFFGNLFFSNINYFVFLNEHKFFILSFVILSGTYVIICFLLIRLKKFDFLARLKMIEFFLRFLFQIFLFSFNYFGLFLGYLFSLVIPILYFFKKKYFSLKFKLSKNLFKKISQKFIDYPKFSTLEALTNNLGNFLPAIFFLPYFGAEITGHYFFAVTIMAIPSAFAGQTISKVYYSLAPKNNQKKLKNFFSNIIVTLIKIIFPTFFIIFFTIQELVVIIFGEKWDLAGIFCSYMCLWFYLKIINNSLDNTINLKKKLKKDFFLKLFFLIIKALALLIGIISNDIFFAVKLFVLANTITVFINLLWINMLIEINISSFLKLIIYNIFVSFLFSTPILLTSFFKFNYNFDIAMYALSFIGVSYFILFNIIKLKKIN